MNSPKQDWTPISLPAHGTYGFCRQDHTHPEGIKFLFDANERESHNLMFTAGGGENDAALAISLNEQNLSPNIILSSGWGEETSIRLPDAAIRVGLNQIEIRAIHSTSDAIGWGIRNVKVVTKDASDMEVNNHLITIDKILSILQHENLQGPELAQYYKIVDEMQRYGSTEKSLNEILIVKKEIESRMEVTIKDILVRLRAARIMGDEKTFKQLLHNTSLWIPDNWIKGSEVLDEIKHRN